VFKQILFFSIVFLNWKSAAAAELRDPTTPGNLPQVTSVAPANSPVVLKLNAIWISEANRRAVINGVSVKTGGILSDGSRLLKIQPQYVLINNHGVVKKILLVPSFKKQVK
jgi:hypothetical protein